jgi:hypothetical protein
MRGIAAGTREGMTIHSTEARASGALPSDETNSLRRTGPPFEASAGIAEPGRREPAANAAASDSPLCDREVYDAETHRLYVLELVIEGRKWRRLPDPYLVSFASLVSRPCV